MACTGVAHDEMDREHTRVDTDMGFGVIHLSLNPSSAILTCFMILGKWFRVSYPQCPHYKPHRTVIKIKWDNICNMPLGSKNKHLTVIL